MQATKQQQIMGYFIEEAKEHLDTIEQGLLNLKATMADSEQLNELFRAAHSVKGGAAMLGLNSIQQVSHHLEDCFKLLKEDPIEIDRQLEDLFLKVFDTLKDLVEELQSPYGLRQDSAEQTIKAAQPNIIALKTFLKQRIKNNQTVDAPAAPTVPIALTGAEIATRLNVGLKKMLELFKQGDSPRGRQNLALLCNQIAQLHNSSQWKELLQTVEGAITNSTASYQTLAPLVIREVKQAGDLLIAGRMSEIVPSQALRNLAPPAPMSAPTSVASTVTASPQTRDSLPSKHQQISIPLEPRAAARVLLEAFNKEQLIQLAEFLMKAIQ